jgi:hypothetical protein
MTDYTMPFGRHRGQRISEIPTSYLRWVLREVRDLDPDLRDAIEEVVRGAARGGGRRAEPTTDVAVPNTAVKCWYRALAMKYHPDRGGTHEAMLAVGEAYETLLPILAQKGNA